MEHAILAELIERIGGICAIENARACHGCILLQRDMCYAKLIHLMEALAGYMNDHFRYEERLMENLVPQDYVADHKADHRFIQRRLLAHLEELTLSNNTAAVSKLAVAELQDWIGNHIEKHDVVLASYVASEEHQ